MSIEVGIISDTHGLLRPEAAAALRGVGLIIHAGDIGKPEVLDELQGIATTVAVRGNVDTGTWARWLNDTAQVPLEQVLVHVLHDIGMLEVDPAGAGFRVVIYGHSHKPAIEERGGVLFLNPGSAGPRRFHLPVSVALLQVDGNRVEARLVELEVGSSQQRH